MDRYRSRSSHKGDDLITSQQLDELEMVVEALKTGFSLGSPFRSIVHGIIDLLTLLRGFLTEGIALDLPTINIRLHQKPFDPLTFEYANEVNKGSTGGEGQPQWYHSGTVASTKTVIKAPQIKFGSPELHKNFEEWLDTVIITLVQTSENPKSDPNFMIGRKRSQKIIQKLTEKQYRYFRRADRIKKQHKSQNKNEHVSANPKL